ncbi:antiviral helicase [Rozella allomycis CSF55]|uniref:Antiviral helicase n=1 Tax=Rozella allomycis (strain CSF55) TaxID=988480 RepID=A0A4P9YEH2_ROZAC|nr:antiviral helicase [Rozella allomycis CSF55]
MKTLKIEGIGIKNNQTLETSKNSTLMTRIPDRLDSSTIRGKATNVPFMPGGMEDDIKERQNDVDEEENFDWEEFKKEIERSGLKTIAPGLDRGLMVDGIKRKNEFELFDEIVNEEFDENNNEKEKDSNVQDENGTSEEIDSFVQNVELMQSNKENKNERQNWAHMIDVTTEFINFNELVPELAHQFPFELDTFQKHAVYHLEKNESVFVAAHTSAGKTVVADYAIALAMKHMTKCIYTSPIKALSNQKYRDFKETFEDVGLLTGDVQIKPEAACLVMTTEILRSMLYRGADLIRDVEFVIFDEVHYVNDAERGVVWEEVIIMLPSHVNLILLSATVPNTFEFANWVGRTKQKDIYVISTLKRPVPLEHYLYAQGQLHKIVDSNRTFQPRGYKEASEIKKKKDDRFGKVSWNGISMLLKKKNLLPCVMFTFSKKRCEENADSLGNMDLNTSTEKSAVHIFVEKSFQRLKGTDRELPQIQRMRDLLSRGIAVHHGGLLPIVKECVEILFQRGLVKILFATETFAMGVNMPARTVVYTSIRKHDGTGFRDLLPGEYTQMSGRAGRRGLDATGTVIIACGDQVPFENTLRQMILGLPTRLESQFRLTYNMMLCLLRIESLRVEDMIKKSFSENSAQLALPEQHNELKKGAEKLENMDSLSCGICNIDIETLYEYNTLALNNMHEILAALLSRKGINWFISTGRVIIINNALFRNCPAVVFKINSKQGAKTTFTCLAIKESRADRLSGELLPAPISYICIPEQSKLTFEVLNDVSYMEIVQVTSEKLAIEFDVNSPRVSPRDLNETAINLLTLVNKNRSGFRDNQIDKTFIEVKEKDMQRKVLLKKMKDLKCMACPDLNEHYGKFHEQKSLAVQVAELQNKLSEKNLTLLPDFESRIKVLKHLQYIDDQSTVQLKGKVACEINTTDELITTELIFDNLLGDYEPAEIIALLSCMVFQEKSSDEPPNLNPKLSNGKKMIVETATRLVNLQNDFGIPIVLDDVLTNLNFGLVEVVYEWARGMSFKDIMGLTNVLEGSIVRCIVRLDETCRELRSAARIVGDTNLYKKMEEASIAIKRDICFAASLYF